MAYKRKRYIGYVRNTRRRYTAKRIRTGRRTSYRRRYSGRVNTYTTRSSGASAFGFRSKRLTPKAYRSILWRDTISTSHYRSVGDVATNVSTPNNTTGANLFIVDAFPAFWTAANGAQPIDTGAGVPTFQGDLVLRGGVARITIANSVNPVENVPSDCMRVTVFAVWTKKVPTTGGALPTTTGTMWDPSIFPDFQRYGRVLFKRDTMLKADGEVITLNYRFRPQKIDQAIFNAGGGKLRWFILCSQCTNTEVAPVPENGVAVTSWNLSFSGEEV